MTLPESARPAGPSRDLAISLAILRITREWSQSELAEAAGVTNSAVSDYERGKVDPQTHTLQKLLRALGLPLSALDETQVFLIRMRAHLDSGPATLAAVPGETASAVSPSDSTAKHAVRMEIAQLASEAGRFSARFVQFLLELLSRERGSR
jgi:transcriptional regulator with XRE-family HTH domain